MANLLVLSKEVSKFIEDLLKTEGAEALLSDHAEGLYRDSPIGKFSMVDLATAILLGYDISKPKKSSSAKESVK